MFQKLSLAGQSISQIDSIEIEGNKFNSTPARALDWLRLQEIDYGLGYMTATFGDNLNMAHNACMHMKDKNEPERKRARDIMQVFTPNKYVPGWFLKEKTDGVLTGNTLIRGNFLHEWLGDEREINDPHFEYRSFIFAQDYPLVENGAVVREHPRELLKILTREVNGVRYSDNGHTRAMDIRNSGFITEEDFNFTIRCETPEEMSVLRYPIFVTGNQDASKKLAEMMRLFRKPAEVFFNYASDETMVPTLSISSYDGRLKLESSSIKKNYSGAGICSFGRQVSLS